jgi:hypothetical protein
LNEPRLPLRRYHLTVQCPVCHEYTEPMAIVSEEVIAPIFEDEKERGEFRATLLQGSRTSVCQNANCQQYGKMLDTRADCLGHPLSLVLREVK